MYAALMLLCVFQPVVSQVAVLNKKKLIVALEQDKAVHFKIRQRFEQHFLDIEHELEGLKKQEQVLLQQDDADDQIDKEEQQQKYIIIQQKKQGCMQQLYRLEQNVQQLCQEELETFERNVVDKFVSHKKYDLILPQYDMGLVIYANPIVDISQEVLKAYHKYRKRTFRTKKEIQELFDLLSVTYLPAVKITYEPFKKIDARHSKFYLEHEAKIDAANRLYRQKVERHDVDNVYIKWMSEQVGYGVFASKDIKRGNFVGEYTGVIRSVESVRDVRASAYSWSYPIDPKFNGASSSRRQNQQMWLDAKYEGNEMRFVNHSDNPNTKVVYVIDSKGILHICYVAIKDIAHDQQLTVSYGENYWKSREKVSL